MKRPIRLTYLITDLKRGGVPLHLYRLATRLPREQFDVRVISLADEGPVGTMLAEAGIPVLACGARSAGDVRALWRLWRFLRSDRPDILHTMLFHANVAGRVVGSLAGIPVARILGEIQTVELDRRWHLVVDNLTCRLCRKEVGNSVSVIEHLHRRAHVPRSRLLLQWGGVDVDGIASAAPVSRVTFEMTPQDMMVVWAGRLDPIKGFEEMLGGFALACSARPVKLVLVGEGNYRPTVERLIQQNGLAGRVLLLGERSDVPAILRAADMFLFCSRTEGLPNALLEAMAAGLPVIATDVPGCRDVVRHGETGFLVKSGSAEAIAGAVTSLLDDPERRRVLGTRAEAWVRANADVRRLAAVWIGIYSTMAAAGPSTPARQSLRI